MFTKLLLIATILSFGNMVACTKSGSNDSRKSTSDGQCPEQLTGTFESKDGIRIKIDKGSPGEMVLDDLKGSSFSTNGKAKTGADGTSISGTCQSGKIL